MTDIVIPAGGEIDAKFAERIGSPYRALAPLGPSRTPLLQQVVNTLREAMPNARIVCIAPDAVRQAVAGVDVWLPAGESGPENMRLGLSHVRQDRPVLLCASDLPLMTVGAVQKFANACLPSVEVAVGLIRASDYEAAFPGAPPSEFTSLPETGPITLGGLFQVRPDLLTRQSRLFDKLFHARKSPWHIAGIAGPRLLWQLATQTLTLAAVTHRAEFLLGGPVQVVPETDPSLAYDTDTLDDYTYAETRFGP